MAFERKDGSRCGDNKNKKYSARAEIQITTEPIKKEKDAFFVRSGEKVFIRIILFLFFLVTSHVFSDCS